MAKRQLLFRTSEDVIKEIERLRRDGYVKHGQWSLTQICDHVEKTLTGAMDGFGFRLPWLLRVTVGNWFVRTSLKQGRMPSVKFPAPKKLQPGAVEAGAEDAAVIERLYGTIQRANALTGTLKDYPVVNEIASDDWRRLMWMHAAHHLGFLEPKGS